MTREDSIRTKTWVTNDGRCLRVHEIDDDHLRAIHAMLRHELPPGYDETHGRAMAQDFVTKRESLLDYTIEGTWAELDLDEFRAAWLQIIDNEVAKRHSTQATPR